MTDKGRIPTLDFHVPADLDGAHLDRVIRSQCADQSWNAVRVWIRGGNVLVDGARALDTTLRVVAGQTVSVCEKPSLRRNHEGGTSSTAPRTTSRWIVHVDSQVVVVEKPAGISTVPYDRQERDTLDRRVKKSLSQGGSRVRLEVVHRIDKETTGLVVFARTQHALERLKSQFRFHTVKREYQALVHGHPQSRTLTSRLVRDRGDGLRGSTSFPGQGRESITHVTVLEKFRTASLVKCRLETGRTHQIRIHLAEAGHPLLGERIYSKGYEGKLLEAPRVLLHAATLGFLHPTDNRPLFFESPLPADFAAIVEKLRNESGA